MHSVNSGMLKKLKQNVHKNWSKDPFFNELNL